MDTGKLPVIYTCFPGGKHKVLTMSFDDGRTEDRRLVSIFNTYGIRGTFNVNSGLKADERRIPLSEYPSLYAGHEVACHTYTHPTIARCPMEQIVKQVLLDREILEDTMGYPVRGLALPNGSDSEEIERVLPSLGIRYARSVKSTGGFSMPDTVLPWDSTCHFNHGLMELGKQFADLYKTQYLYMMYVWGHSYEFDTEEKWAHLAEMFRMMGRRQDVWYATCIQAAEYLKAVRRLVVSASMMKVYNPSAAAVWVEANGKNVCIPGGAEISL